MSLKKIALAGGVAASLMAGTAYASVIDRPFFQVLGVVVVWGADGQDASANAPVVSDFVLLTPASGNAGADLIAGSDVFSVVTGSLDPISTTGTAGAGGTAIDPVTGTGSGNFTDAGTVGVLDAADTMTAFGIDDTTSINGAVGPATHNSSFYVASNAAFDIYATSSALQGSGELLANTTLADISLAMDIDVSGNTNDDGTGLDFGSAAQDPTGTGAGAGNGFTASMTLDTIDGATPVKVFDGGARTAASTGSLVEQSVRFNSEYSMAGSYDLSQGAGTVFADVTYTIFVP